MSGKLESTSSTLRELRSILLSGKDNLDLQNVDDIRGISVKNFLHSIYS